MNRIERWVSRLADRQHGVVTAAQLAEAGIDSDAITLRLRAGRLYRVHRGVYAVGIPNVTREGRWHAGVLACGDGAVLSHRAAAALWDIRAWNGYPEVTVSGDGGRQRRNGLILHRSSTLTPEDITSKQAIPVTAPARTLADLRPLISSDQLEAVIRQAEILRLNTGPQPGYAPEPSGTKLERAFLALCRRHGLPRPAVQAIIGPYTVDFLWSEQRLVVETDGFQTHGTRSAFEADRARDAELMMLGYEVIRFTYRQVMGDPDGVSRIVRGLLRARPLVPDPSSS